MRLIQLTVNLLSVYAQKTMSDVGATPRTLTSDAVTSNLPSSVNIHERNSLTSDLTTIGNVATAGLTLLQSRNEDQSTNAPIGVFHSTLRTAGLDNLALLLGTINTDEIEGVVQLAAQSIYNHIAACVNIIQARIENLQRVNTGPNDNSHVAVEAQIIENAIKEAIDRLQNQI
jgi:hypothetical protein